MINIFFKQKEPGIIEKICVEIKNELYLTDFPEEVDQDDIEHEKQRLVREHTKHFDVAMKIYKDFAENYSAFFKPFTNIDRHSHPKTIIEMVAYDIIYESIHEEPYKKE